MEHTIKRIRQDFKRIADPKIREGGKRFFKESIKLYGIKTAEVSRPARVYFKEIKNKEKEEIFYLCEELWQSGYMEESFIACQWAYSLHKYYSEKDFSRFEKWVNKYVSNWASCDTFCNHTIGTFVAMYPNYLERLKKWAKS
jgi:3-methyladenine DNA glycosylase AlkD